ncbi:hypothetical protein ACIGW0_03825 [Streptomyces bikiniensis]|uniref:Septum formation-related domain-containing protein n=1 Tax=Streptomyces bikiniensis TaxID=1896 RepID=A0ABW8CQ08_STRBI
MISRLARTAALPLALLLLTACNGGDGKGASPGARPTGHPVFDQALDRQVFPALRETREAGSASFTQTLSFGSAKGTAVQTLSGELDFTKGAGEAAVKWQVPEKHSAEVRKTLLDSSPGRASGTASAGFVVDRQRIRYRAASSGYWLRYDSADTLAAGDGSDPIGHLRGSESPIGGILLEGMGSPDAEARQNGPAGNRTYRAEMPFSTGWAMLPADLRKELGGRDGHQRPPDGLPPDGVRGPAGPDHPRPGGHARLLRKSGVLADVTSLTMDLTLTGFGSSKPAAAPTGNVRRAAEAVLPMRDVRSGGCVDFDSGRCAAHVVVDVPCSGPYDARVFAQIPLRPGATKAETQERADIACTIARDMVAPAWMPKSPEIWAWWTPAGMSGPRGKDLVTCYVTTKRGDS